VTLTHMLTMAAGVNLADVNTLYTRFRGSGFWGFEVQRSGLYRSINCSILRRNSPGLENDALHNAFLEKMPNQISTWFSQLADVGVK